MHERPEARRGRECDVEEGERSTEDEEREVEDESPVEREAEDVCAVAIPIRQP